MCGMLLSLLNGRVRRVIGIVVFVAAFAMLAGAIVDTYTSVDLRANGVKTTAAIVDVSATFSRNSVNSYTDLVEFTTRDGKQYRVSIGGSRGDHVGGTVAVVYDPSDPSTVQEASSLSGLWWITPTVLLLFALLFGWLGWRLRRTRRLADQGPQNAVNQF